MTPSDANKLLALAKANYSYAFKTMTKQEMVMLVQSWAFALQDIPADIVMLAFMQLLTVSKWLPTVAEIREKVQKLYYEASYTPEPLDGLESKTERQREQAKVYITNHTWQLRGDHAPELSLDAILSGPYSPAIGSGQMGFTAINGHQDYLMPEAEGES